MNENNKRVDFVGVNEKPNIMDACGCLRGECVFRNIMELALLSSRFTS